MQGDSGSVSRLLEAVQERALAAVDDDLFTPILPGDAPAPDAVAFLNRQFWAALKVAPRPRARLGEVVEAAGAP